MGINGKMQNFIIFLTFLWKSAFLRFGIVDKPVNKKSAKKT